MKKIAFAWNLRTGLFTFGCFAAAVGLMVACAFGSASVSAAAANRDLPIYCVSRDYPVAALTFDAAWGNEDTQQLIYILAKYNVPATFFIVGEWADKYPESVKALHDAGHDIMNHSDSHPYMTKLTQAQIVQEANACNEKIAAITGVTPTLLRPPYGDYNDTLVATLREQGMFTIQWDVDSLDWKNPGVEQIQKRVLEKTQPGSIILFHNAAQQTPAALPGIIEGLIQKGYTFAKVQDLIYTQDYYIDHTGRQFPNP